MSGTSEKPATPKKAGRPPKNGGTAMTSRQRAAEYRQRRHEAAMNADDLTSSSTRALLDGLARRLAKLEDPATTAEIANGARWVAGRIMAELCNRHKITIAD